MPIIRELRGKAPIIGKNVFIAETAVLIGEVSLVPIKKPLPLSATMSL